MTQTGTEQEDDGDIDLDDPGDHSGDNEWVARMAKVHKQDGDPPCCGRCGECFR